jgi:hypothetical protein
MRPIEKNVTIDSANEELVAFARTIDFTELFEHIRTFAGITCAFRQPEISTSRGYVNISFMSDNITSQTGALGAILEYCYIHSFSNGVFKDKQTDQLTYWVSVSIRYQHKDGGSNGMEMVRAWYCGGRWEFVDAGQKR